MLRSLRLKFIALSMAVVVSLPSFSTAFIPDAYLDEAVSAALVAKEDFGNIGGLGLLYGRLTESDPRSVRDPPRRLRGGLSITAYAETVDGALL